VVYYGGISQWAIFVVLTSSRLKKILSKINELTEANEKLKERNERLVILVTQLRGDLSRERFIHKRDNET
jgi:hypothetical protein